MATVCKHLSVEELEERHAGCQDATASRHFQVIWLLARGHTLSQVSATTAFGERWIEQLLARYNAEGPEALGDLRRRNGALATILKPELLAKLRDRLRDPPPDGGLWSSRKVAAWMAGELGLTSVAPQRGWEALKAIGWSIQAPRPKNPKSAPPEEAAAFKKAFGRRCRGGREAPRQKGRGLCHGRASHRPKDPMVRWIATGALAE
jgi:transposase